MEIQKFSLTVSGKELQVIKSNLAEQANGAIMIQYGDTVVLCTAVMSKNKKEIGYFPLVIDYQEKFYASGKIPGSRFIKREARPSESAILTSRLIDRCLRPIFDHDIRNDIQIITTVLSADLENQPDVLAMNGASLALGISNIPFRDLIGAVRVGRVNGNLIINPTTQDLENSDLDLVVAGTKDKINMIEAGAKEIPESEMLKAFELAHTEIKNIVQFQEEIIRKIGKEKIQLEIAKPDASLIAKVKEKISKNIEDVLYTPEKQERMEKLNEVQKELMAYIKEKYPDNPEFLTMAIGIFESEVDHITHKNIIEYGKRSDGRKPDELRALSADVALLPRTHGSGLFVRGQTQALSILTLGAPSDAQVIDTMEEDAKKRFMHHYNFPPFSVGEAGPMRGPGRRDIGHGALAERALLPILPDKAEFPYTIRLVSEILSSNGSSSMASVCGSTLAMMDGGVPIKKMAAGIAMGLMMASDDKYVVLTDIQGPEDHHGDMDFKAAGTEDGITALQMDVKIDGVTIQMLKDTMDQAKKARLEIMAKMKEALSGPRENISKYAPMIITIQIDPKKIGLVIGTGGKTINAIIEETGASIDIEDDGMIFITAPNTESGKMAEDRIKNLTREVKIGEIFEGKVVKVTDFGAFVEVTPGKEGLVHISNLADKRVRTVDEVVKEGDVVKVKVLNIDDIGRIQLSMKDAK